jgi:hypothetical protein
MDTQKDVGEKLPGERELSDVGFRAIVLFGLGLLIFAGVIHVSMNWIFGYFAARQARLDVRPSALADPRQVPPEPRLQITPAQDLQQMRAAEDALLNTYGWVDREAGIVRLPIDRAIQLLAERGLPAQSEQSGTGSAPERESHP